MPLVCVAGMITMMLFCMLAWRGSGGRRAGGGGWMPFCGPGGWRDDDRPSARQILDRRYANGELTEEQYRAMRSELG